jgi:squalene-hopene/tetraprenyl-beta-curcumene cyclase
VSANAIADEPAFVPASDEEPFGEFSLERAGTSLDASAREWQQTNKCCQCHANFMYLIARPALAHLVPTPPDVRTLFEQLVSERWETTGLRYPSEATVVSVPLAFDDNRQGNLSPLTRRALERMLTHQRDDGGWNGVGGSEKTFIRELEETIFAGLGLVTAPDGFAQAEPAASSLEAIRRYLNKYQAAYPYEEGMLTWASAKMGGIWDEQKQQQAAETLLKLQREDGGWALGALLENDADWERGIFAGHRPSDGYGTGFVIFIARQAGVPANDPRLQRGVAWLKTHQRASGRWFTPTYSRRTLNLPSNSGTGYAILALEACGEIPPPASRP